MLSPRTPFPQPGSYALYVDPDDGVRRGNELARILERRGPFTLIALPLRDGAGGNKVVSQAELIDASPLTIAEEREFHELDRALAGREPRNFSKRQRASAARRDALRTRMIMGPILDRLLRFARTRGERRAA